MKAANELAQVYALRCACRRNGYRPLAVYSPSTQFRGTPIKGAGKAPVGRDWLNRALEDPPWIVASRHRVSPLALNTGIDVPVAEWSSRDVFDRFSEIVIGLLRERYGPELDGGTPPS